jgi:FtsP/CotA-like multicopper oxidase with cupredoxin domain
MSHLNSKKVTVVSAVILFVVAAVLLLATAAQAAVPGISGSAATATGTPVNGTFHLTAAATYITQPDGVQIYSWGYGCAGAATYMPAVFQPVGFCPAGQVPGPTLIVTEGDIVTVTLANSLPTGVGNTSIVFPGFQVCAGTIAASSVTATTPNGTCTPSAAGVAGLLTQEATPGTSVTYTFVATTPGTRAYYSGTQTDLQVEMGLYGAVVVKPKTTPAGCSPINSDPQLLGRTDYRLAPAAFDHSATCYDREYLFQWMELDSRIHRQAETQVAAVTACLNPATTTTGCQTSLEVRTEPYHPQYYLINGRSMPDDMDADYAPNYPNQPYNGNPHMHPGDLVLVRSIGQGRWQHPFHEHGNHVRILARDGNLILSQTDAAKLAGRMEFTTDTYPGQSYDGIFYWSGKGLGWDIYGHTLPKAVASISTATESGHTVTVTTIGALPSQIVPNAQVTVKGVIPDGYNGTFTVVTTGGAGSTTFTYTDPTSGLAPYSVAPVAFLVPFGPGTGFVSVLTSTTDPTPCIPDANGFYTSNPSASNYYEWCADHNHPLESNPVGGQIGSGGPATQFDPLIVANGLWYNGTPYLGPDAVNRSRGPTPMAPGKATQNPTEESGIAFMWHSHNEREITTNDVFPGGMLMMMLVDPPVFPIDETL